MIHRHYSECKMDELWGMQVSLTREVIRGVAFNSCNKDSTICVLLKNEKSLGENLAHHYGKKVGRKYYHRLVKHVEIAIKIVVAISNGQCTDSLVDEWFNNMKKIAKVLHEACSSIKEK